MQTIVEAIPMRLNQNIEDYLEYFELVYLEHAIQDDQRVVTLIFKLPLHIARYALCLLPKFTTFQNFKLAFIDKY